MLLYIKIIICRMPFRSITPECIYTCTRHLYICIYLWSKLFLVSWGLYRIYTESIQGTNISGVLRAIQNLYRGPIFLWSFVIYHIMENKLYYIYLSYIYILFIIHICTCIYIIYTVKPRIRDTSAVHTGGHSKDCETINGPITDVNNFIHTYYIFIRL